MGQAFFQELGAKRIEDDVGLTAHEKNHRALCELTNDEFASAEWSVKETLSINEHDGNVNYNTLY